MPERRRAAWKRFCADVERYVTPGTRSRVATLRAFLANEPLWAIGVFRLGQYLRDEAPALVRLAGKIPYGLLHRAVALGLGIHLYPQTQVGAGLYIGHYGGVWISPHATLGEQCAVNHEATIGLAGRLGPGPLLGDRVWVGPNSTITGPVRIGSGVVIGANSLVVSNIEENGVAVGVPARVISRRGSAHLQDVFPAPPPAVSLRAPAAEPAPPVVSLHAPAAEPAPVPPVPTPTGDPATVAG